MSTLDHDVRVAAALRSELRRAQELGDQHTADAARAQLELLTGARTADAAAVAPERAVKPRATRTRRPAAK